MATTSERVIHAAQQGDLESMRALLEELGRETVRADGDPEELTSLHWACSAGNQALVAFLLSDTVGADPGAVRGNCFTPLHAAAMQGHAAICQALLDAGADPDVQTDPQGYCPLHSAAWAGHVEAIRVLLARGARRDLRNYRARLRRRRRRGRSRRRRCGR